MKKIDITAVDEVSSLNAPNREVSKMSYEYNLLVSPSSKYRKAENRAGYAGYQSIAL